MSVVLVAFFGVIFLGEKLSGINWMGVMLIAAGAVLSPSKGDPGLRPPQSHILKAFFTFRSATIIALLTLLGIDAIDIWMLDRQSSKT
jgi:drug/metabolite transporter (DMT)-like permease